MHHFQLVSDGGCDFANSEIQRHGIGIVPFYVTFGDETHLKEGVDITKDEYYKRLKTDKNLYPKTAQPNPQDYIDVYTPYLEAGKNIISLTISSKVSGTYNSALLAANMLKEDYPNRTIIAIDSLNGSVGQGLLLRELIKMRDKGYSITDAAKIAEKIIPTVKTYFTLENLEFLRRGGRIGPTTALVGGVLGLRPVLHLVDGVVEQADSVRGSKKVLKLIEEGVVEALKDDIQDVSISIGHILSFDDATTIKTNIEASLNTKITNPIAEIGVAIGSHVGPGALVISYCKKYETFTK